MMDTTELKKAAEAATQGDWHHYKHGVIKGGPVVQFVNGFERDCACLQA
jgi:hypothetical protein